MRILAHELIDHIVSADAVSNDGATWDVLLEYDSAEVNNAHLSWKYVSEQFSVRSIAETIVGLPTFLQEEHTDKMKLGFLNAKLYSEFQLLRLLFVGDFDGLQCKHRVYCF